MEYNPDPIRVDEILDGRTVVDRIYISNLDISSENIEDAVINGYATSYMNPNYPGSCWVEIHSYDEDYAYHVYEVLSNYLTNNFDNEGTEEVYDDISTYSILNGEDVIASVQIMTPERREEHFYTITFEIRSNE